MGFHANATRQALVFFCLLCMSGSGGCPAPAPFYLMETPEVIGKGEVSFTPSAGVGGSYGLAGGGGLRIRVGVGAEQEVGAEAMAVSSIADSRYAIAAKLSWKVRLNAAVALIVGAGGAETRNTSAPLNETHYFGGDLGVVVAPAHLQAGILRPYLGLRTSLGAVIGPPTSNTPGFCDVAFFPVLSGGLSIEPRSWLRVMLEAGYVGFFSYSPKDGEFAPFPGGGYGGASLVFIAGRK